MKPALSRYYTIAIVVIVIIVASQAYWLYYSFQDNKKQTLKEINTALKEYMLEDVQLFLDNVVVHDTAVSEAGIKKLKLVQNLMKNLSNISSQPNEDISIEFDVTTDSVTNTNVSPEAFPSDLIALRQKLNDCFRRSNISIDYDIHLINAAVVNQSGANKGAPSAHTPNDFLKSDNFSLKSSKHNFFISVNNGTWYILRKMKFAFLFSFVLTLIASFVFIVFIKTISKQIKLNGLKNDFVNNMTHELKTPLATCSAALESIEKFNVIDDKEKTLKYIGLAQNEIARIKNLADMLLTTSSIENKTMHYQLKKTDLIALIINRLQSFEFQIIEKKIMLHQDYSSLKAFIKGDVLHLGNVISNIIDNAIKYNVENGTIDLKVSVGNKTIDIVLTNTGKGFPKEYNNKVFDKFYRVHTGNIHNVKGYGLGLNYAKNVIEDHKGSISISSGLNDLTTLKITLPLYEFG